MIYPITSRKLQFENSRNELFAKKLRERVQEYFTVSGKSKWATPGMVVKTIVMFSLYILPYVSLYLTGNIWIMLGCFFLMGLGKAGLGFSVMHDANHGAYSKNPKVNTLLGFTLNMIGGNAVNWKIQHNVFHHTYTNIDTHDEDIRPRFVLRFSPNAEHRSFHRFQHIYAWFLYGLNTFSWILFKDFAQLAAYQREGILEKHADKRKAWAMLIGTKLFYITYMLVLPTLFTSFSFGQVFLGFFVMHYVAGLFLAVVFQLAHVMEVNEFPDASEKDLIEENWLVHQLQTTCNFASKSRVLSWFIGGLNYQIEHHLFPNICHVHYKALSKIVRKTAEEFEIAYQDAGSFGRALILHGQMLYKLGRA